LNYLFTKPLPPTTSPKRLELPAMNDVVGALDGAKAEFQRRVVAPYEDKRFVKTATSTPQAC
jgi:hypothetical protein